MPVLKPDGCNEVPLLYLYRRLSEDTAAQSHRIVFKLRCSLNGNTYKCSLNRTKWWDAPCWSVVCLPVLVCGPLRWGSHSQQKGQEGKEEEREGGSAWLVHVSDPMGATLATNLVKQPRLAQIALPGPIGNCYTKLRPYLWILNLSSSLWVHLCPGFWYVYRSRVPGGQAVLARV